MGCQGLQKLGKRSRLRAGKASAGTLARRQPQTPTLTVRDPPRISTAATQLASRTRDCLHSRSEKNIRTAQRFRTFYKALDKVAIPQLLLVFTFAARFKDLQQQLSPRRRCHLCISNAAACRHQAVESLALCRNIKPGTIRRVNAYGTCSNLHSSLMTLC